MGTSVTGKGSTPLVARVASGAASRVSVVVRKSGGVPGRPTSTFPLVYVYPFDSGSLPCHTPRVV